MKINCNFFLKNVISIFFLLLLFQSPLSRLNLPAYVSIGIGYCDELIASLFLLILLFNILSRGIHKLYVKELFLFALFLSIGLIGTIINHLQPPPAVIEDIVSCSKFLAVLYGTTLLLESDTAEKILNNLGKISRALTIVLFVLVVIDELAPGILFIGSTDVLGLHAVQLFYYHPAVLAQVSALLLGVITATPRKYNWLYILFLLTIMVTTLTSKAFGFVFLYIFFYGLGKAKSWISRLVIISCAFICIALVSSDAIVAYYGNEQSARYTLMADSLQIAKENMPIGLGFGTFASAAAASYYSPIYVQLGYLSHYGLGYVSTSYLTDTFWPVLFGEFGYLGTCVFVIIIILIIARCLSLLRKSSSLGVCSLSIMGYLLICSTSATAFFNPISVVNALVLGICFVSVNSRQSLHERDCRI